jgi:hypothetical protein
VGWNVPDDWGSYYSNCDLCGSRVHASEGGCYCTEDHTECVGCADGTLEGFYPDDQIVVVDGASYCKGCSEDLDDAWVPST